MSDERDDMTPDATPAGGLDSDGRRRVNLGPSDQHPVWDDPYRPAEDALPEAPKRRRVQISSRSQAIAMAVEDPVSYRKPTRAYGRKRRGGVWSRVAFAVVGLALLAAGGWWAWEVFAR